MEIMTDFIFLVSKIAVDGNCSHEIKRCFLLGGKAMTNLDSILKSRDHFADKGLFSQSYGFSSSGVLKWELDHKEGWAPKNWCFWTEILEKTLESSLDSKEITLSIIKKTNPEYSLKGLMLKLKLQYFGHLMERADSLGRMLMKIEGRRRRGWQRMRCLDGIIISVNMSLTVKETVKDREA